MNVGKLIERFGEKLRAKQRAGVTFTVRPTPALLTSCAREALADQLHNGGIKFPEGWDDIKACMFLACDPKHGEFVRRAAVAHLVLLARCHRTGEALLTDTFNNVGAEIHKNSEDFPQFKSLLDHYQQVASEHNARRAQVVPTVKSFIDRDLVDIL